MSISSDQIVPEFRKSAKTQEDFCADHGISIHKLRYYLYKRGKRMQPLLRERPKKSAMPQPSPSFISFDHHADTRNVTKPAFTIITGRFTINELGELLRAIAGVPC